jgi:glycosyltransferase involved in cell wall biosynthesis
MTEQKPLHIFINAFSARRGGGQTYLLNLLQHLPETRERNLKVTLMVSSDSNLEIDNTSINILKINFPVQNAYLRAFWEKFRLPSLLKDVKADVLFCPGGIVGTKAPKGCKTVTMFRNMIPFDMEQRKKYGWSKAGLRYLLLHRAMLCSMEQADHVIFISEFAKDVILKASKKGIKNYSVIPHGIGINFKEPKEEDIKDLIPYDNYIVYTSTLDHYKSQVELVEAVHLLNKEGMVLPKILLVGAFEDNYVDQVREKIEQYQLAETVIITGPIPYKKMPTVYKNSKFIVFASQSENCPNILLESLASKKAVACSNMPPMPEFGNSSVIYFDPRNPKEIAKAIKSLLKDEDLIKELEEKAYVESQNYSWELTSQKTWKAIKDLEGGV